MANFDVEDDPSICVQIGNTDDKLSQKDWAAFCVRLLTVAKTYGQVHFSGSPPGDSPYQNYCVVVNLNSNEEYFQLKDSVTDLRKYYKQESAAWLEGVTMFI